jgi:hypothetical protein
VAEKAAAGAEEEVLAPAAVTVRRVVSERVCLSQNVWTEPCAIHSMCYLYEVRELVTSHY